MRWEKLGIPDDADDDEGRERRVPDGPNPDRNLLVRNGPVSRRSDPWKREHVRPRQETADSICSGEHRINSRSAHVELREQKECSHQIREGPRGSDHRKEWFPFGPRDGPEPYGDKRERRERDAYENRGESLRHRMGVSDVPHVRTSDRYHGPASSPLQSTSARLPVPVIDRARCYTMCGAKHASGRAYIALLAQ